MVVFFSTSVERFEALDLMGLQANFTDDCRLDVLKCRIVALILEYLPLIKERNEKPLNPQYKQCAYYSKHVTDLILN